MIKKLQARGEARKGRGFGFVTLASEELQQKAVNEMNGKDIEGREIAVKVAIDSPDKTDEEANAPQGDETKEGAEAAAEAPAATWQRLPLHAEAHPNLESIITTRHAI